MRKLTDKVKLERLQEEFNTFKDEKNTEISELKKERRTLNAKITYLEKKLSSANFDTPEMKQLNDENEKILAEMERVVEDNRRLFNRNSELSGLISEKKEDTDLDIDYYPFSDCMEDYELACRKMELYHFHTGYATNKEGQLFFNPQNMIIVINPLTGTHISESHQNAIIKGIKDHSKYQEALKRFEPYKDMPIEPFSEEAELLNKLARPLLPLYIDFFISYHKWAY